MVGRKHKPSHHCRYYSGCASFAGSHHPNLLEAGSHLLPNCPDEGPTTGTTADIATAGTGAAGMALMDTACTEVAPEMGGAITELSGQPLAGIVNDKPAVVLQ